MKKTVYTLVLLLGLHFSGLTLAREVSADVEDWFLYDSFNDNNYQDFKKGISDGGDPMEWFENSRKGWVMCSSTEKGKSAYLVYLLENKFDPNYRQKNVSARVSSPLLCAISFGNLEAVKILYNYGAEPSLKHCFICSTAVDTSAIWMSVISGKYDIADWLYINTKLSVDKTNAVIDLIEKFPFPSSSPQSVYRNNLIASIRANGFDLDIK